MNCLFYGNSYEKMDDLGVPPHFRKPLHEDAAIKNMGIETLEISHDIP